MESSLFAGAGCHALDFPPEYFPSDGYAGLHDPLHAKVLLLRQGGIRGAIATLELPSVRPWALTDALRQFCADTLQIPYENMWLVMTHDLSAPHVPEAAIHREQHMQILQEALYAACCQALSHLEPVQPVLHQGTCRVNANRDVKSADGWWVGINPDRPSDHALYALSFCKEDGRPAAVLYSYAIKSSVLEGVEMSDEKHYATGDITGVANAKAEAVLGCPVLFAMGAAGDQVPRQKGNYLELDSMQHFRTVNLAEKSWSILESLSYELCNALCQTVQGSNGMPLHGALHFGKCAFSCPGQISYPKHFPAPPVSFYDYPEAPEEILNLWSFQIGEYVLLGVKPEVTTPLFHQLQAASPFKVTLLATLVNGGQGYIATDFDYANYTYPGLKTPFRQGTDRVFLQKTLQFLQTLHSGNPVGTE